MQAELSPDPAAPPTTEVIPFDPSMPTTEIIPVDPHMPTTEVGPPRAPGPNTEIIRLDPQPDPNRRFDTTRLISEQLKEEAGKIGRKDMVGLWLVDRNGQKYEFIDHDAYAVVNQDVKPAGMWRPRARSTVRGGPYWGRSEKDKVTLKPGTEHRYTVKVTGPDGAPVDIFGCVDEELNNWLDRPTEEATPFEWFTTFGWNAPVERPRRNPHPKAREIKLDDPDTTVFDTIMEHQEGLGLTLKGVQWKINGDLQRITEDTLTMEGPVGKRRPVRTYVVKTYNAAGDAKHQRVYRDEGLQKHLNYMDGALSDLRQEVPDEEPKPAVISSIGRVGTSFILKPTDSREGWVTGPDSDTVEVDPDYNKLSLEDAMRLLSFEDIFVFDDISRDDQTMRKDLSRRLAENPGDQALKNYAELLQETFAELGRDAVIDMASRMNNEYTIALQSFGFKPTVEDSSMGWMLWTLMEHRYVAKHPDEAEEMRKYADFGIQLGDPFSQDFDEARRKQREILDEELGRVFANRTLKVTAPGKVVMGKVRVADEQGKPVIGPNGRPLEKEQGQHVPPTYQVNLAVFNGMDLQNFITTDVLDVLHSVTLHKQDLGPSEFVRIGRLLRRSIGQ